MHSGPLNALQQLLGSFLGTCLPLYFLSCACLSGSLESAVDPQLAPAHAGQPSSSPLSQPVATIHTVFAVSLYLHISLFFGIAKLGLTTAAGGPRENGHHAKVYFPATHKAAFPVQLRCPTLAEAARQIRRYEALAFRILSSFVLSGEVRRRRPMLPAGSFAARVPLPHSPLRPPAAAPPALLQSAPRR